MGKRTVFRRIMLVAGFLAVTAILYSQSISFREVSVPAKVKTEQSSEQTPQTFLTAPTDAIHGTAVHMEYSPDSFVELLIGNPAGESKPVVPSKELVRYLKILFRAIISPNAP